jgi:predicted protein tyrosine phosphatase
VNQTCLPEQLFLQRIGMRLRVLFVCALNQWRSPTAEVIYRNDPRLDVRSAGIRAEAKRPVRARDIEWAQVIFVMDRRQKAWIQEQFRNLPLPPIIILDIPDSLMFMDPELQRLLRLAIDPEINALLNSEGISG